MIDMIKFNKGCRPKESGEYMVIYRGDIKYMNYEMPDYECNGAEVGDWSTGDIMNRDYYCAYDIEGYIKIEFKEDSNE